MSQQAVTSPASSPHYRDGHLDTGIPVRAVNNSDAPIQWMYDRVKYILQPNIPTFIPYMAMCMYQGDPRSIDLPTGRELDQHRRNEYARLRIHCGVYEDDAKWPGVPHMHVTCYPIDSDVPFNTVLRDPEGVSQADTKADNNQTQFLQTKMEEMANQMRVMQAQLAANQSADAALSAANIDPADLDRQATTSRAITPEEATGQSMVGAHPAQKSKWKVTKGRPAEGEGPGVTRDA